MPHILKRVPRSSLRARNNMALFTQPVVVDGIPFADSDDLAAYLRSMGRGGASQGAVPSAPAQYRQAPPPAAHQEVSPETRRQMETILGGGGYSPSVAKGRGGSNKTFVVAPEKAGGPVSPKQGKYITSSIGGLARLCGSKEAAGDLYSSDILTQMGLTYEGASNVLSEMTRRKVAGFNQSSTDPGALARAAVAREILFSVGGISCAAKSNYGARSNRSNRYR